MRLKGRTHRIENGTKSYFLHKMIKVCKVDFKLKKFNGKDAKNDGYLPN